VALGSIGVATTTTSSPICRHRYFEYYHTCTSSSEKQLILPENVYNMDETGILLSFQTSRKYVVHKDDSRKFRGAAVKPTLVTTVEYISADGKYLLPLIIWPATTHRSHWTTHKTPGWHYACSPSAFANSAIMLDWYRWVFDPQTKQRANHRPRILINDGFGPHESLEVLQFCHENSIILCRLPSHTSHKLQPCDVAVFRPLKTAYRDLAERLEYGGANTISKQHFTSLYDQARGKELTPHNIKSGWAKTGLYPFDPNRVL
jgi:DDE superfamily endonuclease